ncbi:MAG TPA: transaldolase family protein [Gemmatimonadaceae bacterium]|nr:transaldolase family protein [Gemmatimonadaceae bacterium]
MRIFLATATLGEIRWAHDNGLIDGVMTTPALIAAARPNGGASGHELLADICDLADVPVCAAVRALRPDDIYRDGRELAKVSDQIIVQVPLVEDALGPIRRLRADGVRVAATLVFNAAQALLAAKAGAAMAVTLVDQLDAYGYDGPGIVRELRRVFDSGAAECDLVAAFPQNAAQFAACVTAGADCIAVAPAVLQSLLVHPLTDRGVEQFLRDVARRPSRPRIAT